MKNATGPSLTFTIIASCFNCHGSWRSEVRVNLSCCASGYRGRHLVLRSQSSSISSSQNNASLNLFTFSNSRGNVIFCFSEGLIQHFIYKRRVLNSLCLNAVLPAQMKEGMFGRKAPPLQQRVCCNADTCFWETCGSFPFEKHYFTDPECNSRPDTNNNTTSS